MPRPDLVRRVLECLLGAALMAAIVRLAWIGDDAYITLRTVENLLAGHGPVWNVGERVQVYTHPAWMWLLAAARWCTGEHYLTTISLSVVLSMAAASSMARTAGRGAAAVFVLLLASRAFGDYATSGLETPLTAVLLAWLARLDDRTPAGASRLRAVAFATAMLATTRLDLIVLGGPVVLAHLRGVRPAAAVRDLLLGSLPLLTWSAFAAFYYGSPFPITAYAKAFANGVPAADLLRQGGYYVAYSVAHDPLTVVTIVAGVVVGLLMRPLRGRTLALGVLLYSGYVVRMGGDFMAGRFFVPPLVAATALLARGLRQAPTWAVAAVAVVAAGLAMVPGVPPFLQPVAVDATQVGGEHGVIDERRFYFARNGLLSPQRDVPVAGEGSANLRREGRTRPLVAKCDAVGRDPFAAGDLFYFVDRWIVDPLLMRLPVLRPDEWRIGHFTRGIPDGYLESLAADDSRLVHPGLRVWYADLRLVLRAPLWDGERLASLWRLWTGAHADGLRRYISDEYRAGHRRAVRAADLPPVLPEQGAFWCDDQRVVTIGENGIDVDFGGAVGAHTLRVSLAPLALYHLTFCLDGERLERVDVAATAPVGPPPAAGELLQYLRVAMGQRSYEVELPERARRFDRIEIDFEAAPLLVPALGGFELRP